MKVTCLHVSVSVMIVAAPTMCLLERSSWSKGWTRLWWGCVSTRGDWSRSHRSSPTENEDTVSIFNSTNCLELAGVRYSPQRAAGCSCQESLWFTQMGEHTAGTTHHDYIHTAFQESTVLSWVHWSTDEVGCSQTSILNDVRETSQTRKLLQVQLLATAPQRDQE